MIEPAGVRPAVVLFDIGFSTCFGCAEVFLNVAATLRRQCGRHISPRRGARGFLRTGLGRDARQCRLPEQMGNLVVGDVAMGP